MKIVLIGFMGSGKSSVGRELASRLSLPFFEMDNLIAERTGSPSAGAALMKLGEGRFRAQESEVLAEVAATEQGVVSPGGGIVMNSHNQAVLKGWMIIYLHCEFLVILRRLSPTEITQRPLLKNLAFAQELYLRRLPVYRAWANVEIDTSGITAEEVVERAIAFCETSTSRE